MNFDGLDMTNDEWMKKLRSDWFNLTSRMSSNRVSDMPYTAVPMNLDSDTLYPADNLYPSDTLYPSGARNSYYAEDIKNSMQMMKKILIDLIHCSYHLLI